MLRRTEVERALRGILSLLAWVAALWVPAAVSAQVYRVEHLPSFAPAHGHVWNKDQGTPDLTQQVAVPNGAEVTLLDTLGSYQALVLCDGKKICMSQRDLIWAPDLNSPDAVDGIAYNPRLHGLGRFPLHSSIGRFLYSYDAAWWIVAILLAVALLQPMRFIPGKARILVLTGGLVAVLLLETAWGLLLGFHAGWLCDVESLGMWRVLCQLAGYFILLYGQVVLLKTAQALICHCTQVEPRKVMLRWAVLFPLPVFFAAAWFAERFLVRDWMQVTALILVAAVILILEIRCMVGYYRRLGRTWGAVYLVLFCALQMSMVVLLPLTVGLGLIGLAIVLFCVLILWLLSLMRSGYPVVINNYYYNRYYLNR